MILRLCLNFFYPLTPKAEGIFLITTITLIILNYLHTMWIFDCTVNVNTDSNTNIKDHPVIASTFYLVLLLYREWLLLSGAVYKENNYQIHTVVVKRQAEEGGKRAPHKLRAQRNLKLKTRTRLNKRARKQKRKKVLESNLRLSWILKWSQWI